MATRGGTAHNKQGRCFWDGEEVPEAEYLRRKFCLCGSLNAAGRLMCARCLKAASAANTKAEGALAARVIERALANLKRLEQDMSLAISLTPTSRVREIITEANIHIMAAQEDLRQAKENLK